MEDEPLRPEDDGGGSVEALVERTVPEGRVRSLGDRNLVLGGTSGRGVDCILRGSLGCLFGDTTVTFASLPSPRI